MHDRPLLVIGNRNYSSWSLRPWLLLRQHGVSFDELRIPLDTPAFARDIGAWSPSRTVPALRHGALTVWDSLAICEYASESFLAGGGWPRDAHARAVARSASAEMHSGFRALRSALPFNCRRRTRGTAIAADVAQDIARVFDLWNDCRARFGGAGAFLFGSFSIADAMYAPVALRFLTYGVGLDSRAQAYVEALLGLEALQEWLRDARAEPETLAATDAIA